MLAMGTALSSQTIQVCSSCCAPGRWVNSIHFVTAFIFSHNYYTTEFEVTHGKGLQQHARLALRFLPAGNGNASVFLHVIWERCVVQYERGMGEMCGPIGERHGRDVWSNRREAWERCVVQ